jgi:hypothetical protein
VTRTIRSAAVAMLAATAAVALPGIARADTVAPGPAIIADGAHRQAGEEAGLGRPREFEVLIAAGSDVPKMVQLYGIGRAHYPSGLHPGDAFTVRSSGWSEILYVASPHASRFVRFEVDDDGAGSCKAWGVRCSVSYAPEGPIFTVD